MKIQPRTESRRAKLDNNRKDILSHIIATVRMKNWRERIRIRNRSEDPIEDEIRQAASNGRNNFYAIAARFGPTDPRGVDRKTCPIYQQFSRGGGIRSKRINSRGGSATICFVTRGKISGAARVTAEELKTASKINSRPLIQNTYSTCDTFAV